MKRMIVLVLTIACCFSAKAEPVSILWSMVGYSMNPTIDDGELLLVDWGVYATRGDIVICYVNDTTYCKRLVAIPGDTVYRKNGVSHVVFEQNGNEIDDVLDITFAKFYPNGSLTDFEKYMLGTDEYFVVGDNRYNSHDSRDWDGPENKGIGGNDGNSENDFGPLSSSSILGKVSGIVKEIDFHDFSNEYVPDAFG